MPIVPVAPSTVEQHALKGTVIVSIAFLAWSSWCTLGAATVRSDGPGSTWVLHVDDRGAGATEKTAWTGFDDLVVDGLRVRWSSTLRTGSWAPGEGWNRIAHASGSGDASVSFRGHHALVDVSGPGRDLIWIERDGVRLPTVRPMQDAENLERFVIETPGRDRRTGTLLASVAVLVAAAALLAPWRGGRHARNWVLLHVGALQAMVWLTQPIASVSDAKPLLDGIRQFYVDGSPQFFPPGYSAFMGAVSLVPALELGNAVTLFQGALLVGTAVWIHALLARHLPAAAALPIVLVTFSTGTTVFLARAIYSETLAVFGMVGSLYYAGIAVTRGRPWVAAGAGALAGVAGLARIIPLAGIFPAVALLILAGGRGRRVGLALAFFGSVAAVMLAPMIWFRAHDNEFQLVNGAEAHLYQRVVRLQKLVDRDEPATREVVQRIGFDPAGQPYWVVKDSLLKSGVPYERAMDLLGAMALEGVASDPAEFVAFGLGQFARQLFFYDPWDPLAYGTDPLPAVENAPLLSFSRSAGLWRSTLLRWHEMAWPAIALAAILAVFVLLRRHHEHWGIFLLATAAFSQLFATAFTENLVARYLVPVKPLLTAAALATLLLIALPRWRPQAS